MRAIGTPMDKFDPYQWFGHGGSVIVILATLASVLPAFAALAAVIWYAVQIYESDTCQKMLEARRMKRKARRIARLRAEQKLLLAELEALTIVRDARVVAEQKVSDATAEAAVALSNQRAHEKINADAGKVIKSTPTRSDEPAAK